MATKIETLWKQALHTFTKKTLVSTHIFEENFNKLKSLADQITSLDVKLDSCLLDKSNQYNEFAVRKEKPPVTYIEIYEDSNITIGIFVLNRGVKLPLHDHPQMHGILKVISGTVKIQSYTILQEKSELGGSGGALFNISEKAKSFMNKKGISKSTVLAEKLPAIFVSEHEDACILSPHEGNLHEIHSVEGPAAFLDILSPPYETETPDNDERSCHYFQEIPSSPDKEHKLNAKITTRLSYIPSPPEFWSDSAPYQGPQLRL